MKLETKFKILMTICVLIGMIGIWQPHNETRIWICTGLILILFFILFVITKEDINSRVRINGMQMVNGAVVNSLPFGDLTLVGVLLFPEYPSTIVYKNERGLPIIKEWVDCNADWCDKTIDRYFYYAVTKLSLSLYISGEIPHARLIKLAVDGYVYFQDEGSSSAYVLNTDANKRVAVKKIPRNYMPKKDFVFRKEDGVDMDEILNFCSV